MPLYAFTHSDVGVHDSGDGPVQTLIEYVDELGADDVAAQIMSARGRSELRAAIRNGLQVLQELTVPDLEWEFEADELRLV